MSLPLIPAPTAASTDDGTFVVTDALGVTYPPELATIAVHFADDLETDSGIALTPGATGITLELGGDGLDGVPPAAGLRADGREADADERYGLEITGDGIRIWGPTPEAIHRGLTSLRQLITANTTDGTETLPTAR